MGSIDVDGPAVLRAIVDNPEVFPDIKVEIIDSALKLVTAQLKAKTISLPAVQDIYRAIGEKDLERVLESVADKQISTLVKKLDANNADVTTATPQWNRKHILNLTSGFTPPVEKTRAPRKKTGISKKSSLAPEHTKAKRALVAKSIKLGKARELWRDISETGFTTVLDAMSEQQIGDLVKRLDPDHADVAGATTDWQRNHIVALARGDLESRSITESAAHDAAKRRRAAKSR